MARLLRSRHTPYAEIWLLPVSVRRQEVLIAARTPLRDRVVAQTVREAATGADCRVAARRSREKKELTSQDKSINILLAPSE